MTNKPDYQKCLKLLDSGFSLITVGDDKIPNFTWKKYQTEIMPVSEFELRYNYQSGIKLRDGSEMKPTTGIGIATGYNGLECIDIDLKVLNTITERDQFWKEYISILKDNIEYFESKFVIVKTRNFGYHILYRTSQPTGNKKIAVLKAHKEAIIESRGIGGYVWIYDQFLQGKSYQEIKEISIEDREILWSCSKLFNHIEDNDQDTRHNNLRTEHLPIDVTVWDDFNSRNTVWDLVRNEFTIVRKLSDKTVIRRLGATSPHSGYIFDNSKCMYLFSTGTIYPNEKLLTPFCVYTYQKFNGNFSEAAKQLYKDGYGSRIKPKDRIKTSIQPPKIKTDTFPIEVFPDSIQNYIIETQSTLNASIDYLGCSLLWALSLCVGNSIKVEVKKGWTEAAVLWIAIVGRAGIGKSHNINAMTYPLNDINIREIKRYNDQMKKYNEYRELSKKEQSLTEEVQEPRKSQFIVGDITLEALFDYHAQNKNGIGILRDELSGWIKDLNKYRQGSDLETYLSCWSNQQIILTRKTAKSSFVSNAFVPIIGGVQPSILSMHYTAENKDNGFIDRWLLCYPDLEVEKYNEREMNDQLIQWYKEYLIGFFDAIRNNIIQYDDHGNILSAYVRFDEQSKKEWVRIFNKITEMQNSEDENEYMKSILPKQKSYVARFALLLNLIHHYDGDLDPNYISKESILGAEKLSDYFIKMAKKNKFETMEQSELKDIIKRSGKITAKEKFSAIFYENPNFNKTKIAEQLNVSRVTINSWIKEINENNQKSVK